MDLMELRRTRLRQFLADHGGFAAVAARYGLSPSHASYLSQLTAKESAASFGERSAANWERRLHLKPGYLSSGFYAEASKAQVLSDEKLEPGEVDLSTHPDLVPIRRVKLKICGGFPGFAVEPIEDEGVPVFFRSEWMRARGYKHEHMFAIKVAGQSMAPNLNDGDMVIVNTLDTEPRDGQVYAINYHGEPIIKRLSRDNGIWWLVSDNPDKSRYPTKECREQFTTIVGRVIHKQSEMI